MEGEVIVQIAPEQEIRFIPEESLYRYIDEKLSEEMVFCNQTGDIRKLIFLKSLVWKIRAGMFFRERTPSSEDANDVDTVPEQVHFNSSMIQKLFLLDWYRNHNDEENYCLVLKSVALRHVLYRHLLFSEIEILLHNPNNHAN